MRKVQIFIESFWIQSRQNNNKQYLNLHNLKLICQEGRLNIKETNLRDVCHNI